MKVARKNQSEQHQSSDHCLAIEYPIDDKDINVAIIELTGRYPSAGRVVNLECKELAYVMKGSGKVVIEDQEINLGEGDMVLMEPGEKFFWDGNLTLFMPCAPAWYPEQYKETA
jgi:mannose-6-phosphate isomerase-like protein (cupin superfamily)